MAVFPEVATLTTIRPIRECDSWEDVVEHNLSYHRQFAPLQGVLGTASGQGMVSVTEKQLGVHFSLKTTSPALAASTPPSADGITKHREVGGTLKLESIYKRA